MKYLICGDRNWTDLKLIDSLVQTFQPGDIVVEGDARGADKMAGYLAKKRGLEVRTYPADWSGHGKAAGPIRNMKMFKAEKPDKVFAFHNDIMKSKGTKHMVDFAMRHGCQVELWTERGVFQLNRTMFDEN